MLVRGRGCEVFLGFLGLSGLPVRVLTVETALSWLAKLATSTQDSLRSAHDNAILLLFRFSIVDCGMPSLTMRWGCSDQDIYMKHTLEVNEATFVHMLAVEGFCDPDLYDSFRG